MTRCPAHGNRIQMNPSRAVNLFGATPQPDCRRTRGGVLLEATAEGIGLADVNEFAAAIRIRSQQHVDAGALRFGPGEEFRQLGAGHHKADAAPVALLHDAHAFRDAGWDKQAERKRLGGCHVVS